MSFSIGDRVVYRPPSPFDPWAGADGEIVGGKAAPYYDVALSKTVEMSPGTYMMSRITIYAFEEELVRRYKLDDRVIFAPPKRSLTQEEIERLGASGKVIGIYGRVVNILFDDGAIWKDVRVEDVKPRGMFVLQDSADEIRFDYEPLPEGAQFRGFCDPCGGFRTHRRGCPANPPIVFSEETNLRIAALRAAVQTLRATKP